ncbi:MAG: HAD family hydrolase [Solirubrobacteraceae bacterium]
MAPGTDPLRGILPVWRVHRHTGMGGDQIVGALCGENVEARLGDQLRSAHDEEYGPMLAEMAPVAGVRELIGALRDRGHRTVLASSARRAEVAEVEHYLQLLDARSIVTGWTTAEDVRRTKPAPDLVHATRRCAQAEPDEPALMVGDTPSDIRTALAADVRTVAVITGGFSEHELREAGALDAFESVAQLNDSLTRTPLAAGVADPA